MIIVDKCIGSGELLPLFPPGDAKLGTLTYGDFAFTGNGPDGCPYIIAVERKTIGDLLNSMTTGRLADTQLRGLLNSYNIVWILVEGMFRPDPRTGQLQHYKYGKWCVLTQGNRSFMTRDVWLFLNTLGMKAGVSWVTTSTPKETVLFIQTLYRWWNDKEWEQHRSHLQPKRRPEEIAQFVLHTLVRRVASQLKGVGWEKAGQIAKVVKTVEELVAIDEQGLREVDGVGKKLAGSIHAQLKGEVQ